MNILQRLGNWIASIGKGSAVTGQPLSVGRTVISLTSPVVYYPVNDNSAIDDGYNGNVAIYSIVNKDVNKFSSIPIFVYAAKKEEQKAHSHPIIDLVREVKAFKKFEDKSDLVTLINQPNPTQGQDAFLATARAYYKICGEAFIWLNRGDLSTYKREDGTFDDMAIDRLPVLQMYVLPSNYVAIIPDPTDMWGVLGYALEVGERFIMRKGDVIHWKNTNIDFDVSSRTHSRGMSPLVPGSKTMAEFDSLSLSSLRSAQNDGAKAVIFDKSMKSMTPTQQSDLKRIIDAKINNNDVADAVATLQGDWGVIDLSMSAHDQQMTERRNYSWKELCFLLGVPNEFFDTGTTFANKEQAQIAWVTNDIIPACKQFNDELNRVLLKSFNLEGKAFIASDYSELPELKKELVKAAKEMQDIWSIAPDDIREVLGYDRLGGLFAEPWVISGRVPLSDVSDQLTVDELEQQAYGRTGKNSDE